MERPEVTIRIRVNGRERRVGDGTRLTDLIESLGLDRRFLVVEYNGEPRSRQDFDAVVLREGDRLELVRPVAGG
jgi:sulfur carrier protein